MNLGDLVLVVAVLALEGVLLQPSDRCHQSADVANYDHVSRQPNSEEWQKAYRGL